MSFPNIFKRSKPIPPNTEGKFGLNFIFPEAADLSVLKKAWHSSSRSAGLTAPQSCKHAVQGRQQDGQIRWLCRPDRSSRSPADRQPPFVDQRLAPIVDEAKAYPGAWVMLSIRPLAYDKGVNKGVSFGLQSVMFICDDKDLGGASANPNRDFAGVSITNDVNPAAAFGAAGPEDDEDVDVFA